MEFVGNSQLVAGSAEMIEDVLLLLEKSGVKTSGNSDLYIRTYGQFGIDDAQEIRERASSKGIVSRRVFVLSMPGMTTEAQNALLKTLEEPMGDALFFFIVPSPQMLLPTLRSRMQALTVSQRRGIESVDSRAFLSATIAKRLDMLKPLLEKDDDDKRNLGSVITFLSSLEAMLGKIPDKGGLDAVYRARKYLGDKGSLVKPLLEQVALLVPIMKA